MKRIINSLLAAGVLGAVSLPASASTENLGALTPPAFAAYGDSFASQVGAFVDDFTFTLSPSGSFETIAATINLGNLIQIDNLQARLFQGSAPFNAGVTPLDQSWSTAFSAAPGVTGQVVVITPISLAANTYTLEVRGSVDGTFGGAYAGVLDIAPVPEPGGYALMLAGLALIGGIVARRRRPI